ncbi:MAG: hypothetical protein RJB19_494, partial [Pseudomonadota bacterium]
LPAMIHGDQVRSEDEARLLAEEKQRPASDDAGLRIKGLVVYLISLALVLTAYYLSL